MQTLTPQTLQTIAGAPSLRSIVARASSARVIDLHGLAIECADDPDHRERPLFIHPVLNRAIITKHHIQPGEYGRWTRGRLIATKVIFPFDAADLGLGGQFLFIDEPDFVGQLARHLDYGDADMNRDVAVLKLLDRLPTLDPFLVREGLSEQRITAAPCYFRLSDTDRTQMLTFVARQVEALIRLCFDKAEGHDDEARRLSTLLLAEGDSPELDPLRQTLRMTPPEFAEAMFCWKAVLYYRWRSKALLPQLRATRRSIAEIRSPRHATEAAPFLRAAADQLEGMVSESVRQVGEAFKRYDAAYASLTVRRSPEDFQRFLRGGARMFGGVGERMGRLEQLSSFWSHRFPAGKVWTLAPEVVLDAVRDLLHGLSLTPPGAEGAAKGRLRRYG